MTVNDVLEASLCKPVIIELMYVTYDDFYGIKLRVRETRSNMFDDLTPFKDRLVKEVDCFSNLTVQTRQIGRDYGYTNRDITEIVKNWPIVRTIRLYI